MNIVFLDFDGVLNSQTWFNSQEHRDKRNHAIDVYQRQEDKERGRYLQDISSIDPRSVECLNSLVKETKASIVLSTSWRNKGPISYFEQLFQDVGIEAPIIGKTPRLGFINYDGDDYRYSVPRGCEIKAWLETNKDKLGRKLSEAKYVILDDDSDMLYWQRDKFVWCDPYVGLTPNTAYKAGRILKS